MGSEDDEFRRLGLSSRCEWHPQTVCRLLDSYAEKCTTGKGYLKTKDWEEIVSYVNIQMEGSKVEKTMKQCREKVDSLKRRYKLERRKAELRGTDRVEWAFFDKVDFIMRCVRREDGCTGDTVSDLELVDFDGSFGDSHADTADFLADDAPSARAFECDQKGKRAIEDDRLCDVVLNTVGGCGDGVEIGKCKKQRCFDSVDEEIPHKKLCFDSVEEEHPNMKNTRDSVVVNPIQALADALVGFSEVYTKIEVAKMEIFAKMNVEIAKLRKWRKGGEFSGSTSGSDSDSDSDNDGIEDDDEDDEDYEVEDEDEDDDSESEGE